MLIYNGYNYYNYSFILIYYYIKKGVERGEGLSKENEIHRYREKKLKWTLILTVGYIPSMLVIPIYSLRYPNLRKLTVIILPYYIFLSY